MSSLSKTFQLFVIRRSAYICVYEGVSGYGDNSPRGNGSKSRFATRTSPTIGLIRANKLGGGPLFYLRNDKTRLHYKVEAPAVNLALFPVVNPG
jgi:hypothetical protein